MFRIEKPVHILPGPFGVPVCIYPSLLFLIVLFVDFGGTSQALAYDVMFLLLLVASILLHETGHAWAALVQGGQVDRIGLHGCGGYCARVGAASRSEREFITVMGPLVNLAVWALASLVAPLIPDPEIAWVFSTLAWLNLWLFAFNMVPAQPLDGGKLLYLLLTRLLPPEAALRVAGAVGLLVAFVFLPLLLWSWWALGMVLFFLPSISQHVEMLRGETA